jgi:hypothetical protein
MAGAHWAPTGTNRGEKAGIARPQSSVICPPISVLRSPQAGGESPGIRVESRDINFRTRLPFRPPDKTRDDNSLAQKDVI